MTVELDNAALCSYNVMYDATLLDMGNISLDQALFIIPHIISAQHNGKSQAMHATVLLHFTLWNQSQCNIRQF